MSILPLGNQFSSTQILCKCKLTEVAVTQKRIALVTRLGQIFGSSHKKFWLKLHCFSPQVNENENGVWKEERCIFYIELSICLSL